MGSFSSIKTSPQQIGCISPIFKKSIIRCCRYDCGIKSLVSITEANQNFSHVARLVDENGSAVILKSNVPRYVLEEFSRAEREQLAEDEGALAVSRRLIAKVWAAYEELAK